MHLLLLGITKYVRWMTMKRRSTFNRAFSTVCQICRYFNMFFEMKLEWFKIIPIWGSNFSGWVSKNVLALSQISKWVYSIVVTMHSSSEKNVCLFDIPRSKWNINQNKTWLKLCGLETKANVTTLHETVDHYWWFPGHIENMFNKLPSYLNVLVMH